MNWDATEIQRNRLHRHTAAFARYEKIANCHGRARGVDSHLHTSRRRDLGLGLSSYTEDQAGLGRHNARHSRVICMSGWHHLVVALAVENDNRARVHAGGGGHPFRNILVICAYVTIYDEIDLVCTLARSSGTL